MQTPTPMSPYTGYATIELLWIHWANICLQGQGPNQQRLADYCADPSIDIINLAFVNIFPDQAPGNYPGDDFGNACNIGMYQTPQGVQTLLRDNCPTIGPDIVRSRGS